MVESVFALAFAAFFMLCSLVGFRPRLDYDGWTMYRDRVLVCAFAVFLLWLLAYHLPFGIIFALLAIRYRGLGDLQGFVIWTVVLCVWLFLMKIDERWLPLITAAVVLGGLMQICFLTIDSAIFWHRRLRGRPVVVLAGSLGNRTYMGAYLVMIAPLVAVPEIAYILVIFSFGILLTMSRGAIAAHFLSLLIVWPTWALGFSFLVMVAWLSMWERVPTSSLRDATQRLIVWKLAVIYTLKWPHWLIGHGYNSFSKRFYFWVVRYGAKEGYVHVHNDMLQFFYEYGLCGITALAILTYGLSPYLSFGRPLVGSVVGLLIVSQFTFPNHIAPVAMTALALVALLARGVY